MRISSVVRRLFRTAPAADPAARDALQAQLMGSLPAGRPPRRSRRWLAGLAIGGVALAGACVAPKDYELSVGHRIVLTAQGADPGFDPEDVAHFVEENYPVEQLSVMVSIAQQHSEPASAAEFVMTLDVVGRLDFDEVEMSLIEHFPAVGEAEFDVESLDGTVHGTLGGMLSARTLGWHLDEGSVEQTRARILADLAARGLEGNATVEIDDEETPFRHRREVRVRVETERETDGPSL